MQGSQGAAGLQALRSSINQALADKQSAHRIVELSLAGSAPQRLSLEPPRSAPSGWGNFMGALRSLAGEDPMTKLTSAITQHYGAGVGDEIARTLRGRELTVGLASDALSMADRLDGEARAEARSRFETRLAASFIVASPTPKEAAAAASFWPGAPPQQVRDLLVRIAAGPGDTGKLSPSQQDGAIRTAVNLFTLLRDAPGMSETRAMVILKFAARSQQPQEAAQLVRDHVQPPEAYHVACGEDAFARNAWVPKGFPAGLSARGASTEGLWQAPAPGADSKGQAPTLKGAGLPGLHAEFAHQVERMCSTTQQVSPQGQAAFEVSSELAVDASRVDMSVCGVRCERSFEALVTLLRSKLPEGRKGDQLALVLSACLTQAVQGPTDVYLRENGFMPIIQKRNTDQHKAYDLWQSADGNWNVQHTYYVGSIGMLEVGKEVVDLDTPLAQMMTSRITIAPGQSDQELPRIVKIASDASFTSGPLPQGTQEASQAS